MRLQQMSIIQEIAEQFSLILRSTLNKQYITFDSRHRISRGSFSLLVNGEWKKENKI